MVTDYEKTPSNGTDMQKEPLIWEMWRDLEDFDGPSTLVEN